MTMWSKRIYTYYVAVAAVLTFAILYPFFLCCIWVPAWNKYGRKINQYWAKTLFSIIFLPVKVEVEGTLEKGKSYIFLANHFSYLDVPMMGFIPGDAVFVGKASIRKAPFFGYYFKIYTSQWTEIESKAAQKPCGEQAWHSIVGAAWYCFPKEASTRKIRHI